MITNRDQVSSLFWLAISIVVCVESMQGGVGSFMTPGPGFFPFWSALILGGLAMILAVTSFLRKEREKLTEQWIGVKWGKVIIVVASLLIYSLLLDTLGYLITTLGLMLFLFAVTGRSKMWSWLGSALLATLLSYLVFYSWLNVQLPKGKLGF
jgi:putative tricarboxylic transport membrane protein